MNDTIAALATPLGEGGISVIRISGENALSIATSLFHSASSLLPPPPQKVLFGEVREPESGKVIDEVLLTYFKAPKSYTGEDLIEISCHGSEYIQSAIMQLLIENGCLLAKRGEFTLRAFLNGKLDLSQAEAVANLIGSKNEKSLNLAL